MPSVRHVRGVRLRDGKPSRVGKYVHLSYGSWRITSDVPTSAVMLSHTPLDRDLPGVLGCFVYPSDATFHSVARKETTALDLQGVLREEETRVPEETHLRLKHISVPAAHACMEGEEEEEEEEREDEDDYEQDGEEGNEEYEEDGVAEVEWESDPELAPE